MKEMDLTTISGKYSQTWPEYVTTCNNGETYNQAAQSVNRDVVVVANEIGIVNSASAIGNDNTSMPGVEIKTVVPYGGLIQRDGSFSATQKVIGSISGNELIMTQTMTGVISEGKWEGKISIMYTVQGITCNQDVQFVGTKQD
jgi:hypothetical protein